MKKIISILLVFSLCIFMFACAEENSNEKTSSSSGKVLVAYFSHTGNTKKIAG